MQLVCWTAWVGNLEVYTAVNISNANDIHHCVMIITTAVMIIITVCSDVENAQHCPTEHIESSIQFGNDLLALMY